ncbi:AraC family transcriptional regulator [Paraburkholderia aromaticivorans]|uniref:AraC family transcriptional regulator n=1 Tax=Paraburkholderia aromaticivorans TaxID=2026199 RepID=UPI0014562301|nr:AraC family transcriptional regulator [Paraburkholderia aromaticivorans]
MTETPKMMPTRRNPQRQRNIALPRERLAGDVFFDVFDLACVRGGILGDDVVEVGQTLKFAPGDAYIHIIHDAVCQLRMVGNKGGLALAPGDVVILPHAHGHTLERRSADDGATKQQPATSSARVTTGVLEFDGSHGRSLVNGLPRILHVQRSTVAQTSAQGAAEWLPMTVAAIEEELRHPSIGSAVMLAKIADLLFIWAIRHWLAGERADQKGWIAALRDPAISHALSLMHANPGHNWTVSQLAEHVAQSRSNFSQRFVQLVGESPMRYLTIWRMELASNRLISSSLRVSQIAEQLGYMSQAAFSRVFRRAFGMSPTDYRERV